MHTCKKYLSLFRLRFNMGLQYRVAALSGVLTQFVWGILRILAFHAFYRSDPAAFPMTIEATVNYVWMQQAFLAIFALWSSDREIFESIRTGGVAYELCRPTSIYAMWFSKDLSTRLSNTFLRCIPILLFSALFPAGYRLTLADSAMSFLSFIPSFILGTLLASAITVLIYVLTFFTISPYGIRSIFMALTDILSGFLIPLPFFPDGLREICDALPFAAVGSTPLRIYSGDIAGMDILYAMLLQVFWLAVIVLIGALLMRKALRRVVVQGG